MLKFLTSKQKSDRKHYIKNKARIIKNNKKYYKSHILGKKQYDVLYACKNRKRLSLKRKRDRILNPVKFKNRNQDLWKNNKKREQKRNKANYLKFKPKRIKASKSYYNSNKSKVRDRNVTPKARYVFTKSTAKRRGFGFNLSFKLYSELIKASCYYCGGILSKSGSGLDRIYNTRGYVKNNVVSCCARCNISRSNNFTSMEWKVMINAYLELGGK